MAENLSKYFAGEEYEPSIGKTKVKAVPSITYATRRSETVGNKRAKANNGAKGANKRNKSKKAKQIETIAPVFMKTVTVSETNFAAANTFMRVIQNTPLYFINGHACICPLEGPCLGDEVTPFFPIQPDTYLLTFGTPTDFSCLSEQNLSILLRNADAMKKFLWLHASSNMAADAAIGVKKFSFFADLRRAAQRGKRPAVSAGAGRAVEDPIVYPNLAYTFNPDKDAADKSPAANPYGVYRIDVAGLPKELNNTLSILPQDASRKNWFLQDIVNEVYAKTRMRRGIFLNGGCLSSCTKTGAGHMEEAARIMDYAHAMYPTIRETLTAEEALLVGKELPTNRGTSRPFTYMDPANARAMVQAGLYDAKAVANMNKLYHPENAALMAALGVKKAKEKK
jgi:hypothetical protein